MNKTLLATLISGSILLAGCDDSIDSPNSSDVDSPIVSFNPAAGVLSTPNDLLMDLNPADDHPDADKKTFLRLAGIPDQDDADVFSATAQLDGWGLTTPFTIKIELPDAGIYQTKLDAASVKQTGVVRIFKCTTGAIATKDCVPNISELVYGTDYSLTASSDGIVVTPLKPLDAGTGYFIGVTNFAKDSYGQSVTRSVTYAALASGQHNQGDPQQEAMNELITGTHTALSNLTGLSPDDFMYSATWTTQDVESTAQAVMDNIVAEIDNEIEISYAGYTVRTALGLPNDGSPASNLTENIQVWKGTLNLPYYLPFPGSPQINTSLTCDFSDLCGNWKNSHGQSPWKGMPGQPTAPFASPEEWIDDTPAQIDVTPNQVEVLVLMPTVALTGNNPVKIAQYIHGIGSHKETAFAIAPALAQAGFAVVTIDHPLHGSRSFGPDSNGVYAITATKPTAEEDPLDPYAKGNPAVFANLGSLLTARDNLRQAASDQLALRFALNKSDFSNARDNIIENDVSLVGVSLGSIVGTVAQGMSETRDIMSLGGENAFRFNASALSVGGAQVGPILGYSNSFGPTTKTSLVGTTSFSGGIGPKIGYTQANALLLQAAGGDAYCKNAPDALKGCSEAARKKLGGITTEMAQQSLGATPNQAKAEFGAMVSLGYPGFLRAFINGAQAVVDGGDSSIWATKTTTTPTLAHQVLGDKTVPNKVVSEGYPLAGTYGWLNTLDLEKKSASAQGPGLRVFANFTAGSHTSVLDPSASQDVTTEMQKQIANFLGSQGMALVVTEPSVVE